MSRIKLSLWAIAFALGFIVAVPGHASAQTVTSGSVVGTVTDQSGAVVPAASVELKEVATGAVRRGETNTGGQYTFTTIPPGIYTVTVIAKGFRQGVVTGVEVKVAKSSLVDVSLQLGAV